MLYICKGQTTEAFNLGTVFGAAVRVGRKTKGPRSSYETASRLPNGMAAFFIYGRIVKKGAPGLNAQRFSGFFDRLEEGLQVLLGLRGSDRRRQSRGEDRRTRPRVSSRNLIRVVRSDGIPQSHVFNLLDISESGFQFAGLKHLVPGSHLEVVVNIREFNRQIPMDARIVWSQPIAMKVVWTRQLQGHSRMRQTGAQIVAIAETDRYALQDFVDYKIQDSYLN